jgi:hypothetical protein
MNTRVRDLTSSVLRIPAIRVFTLTWKADPLSCLTLDGPERKIDERLRLTAYTARPESECGLDRQLSGRRPCGGRVFIRLGIRICESARTCLSAVAIGAPDVALVDLSLDPFPGPSTIRVGRNIRDLVSAVVELKNDDVSLTAVDAGMIA